MAVISGPFFPVTPSRRTLNTPADRLFWPQSGLSNQARGHDRSRHRLERQELGAPHRRGPASQAPGRDPKGRPSGVRDQPEQDNDLHQALSQLLQISRIWDLASAGFFRIYSLGYLENSAIALVFAALCDVAIINRAKSKSCSPFASRLPSSTIFVFVVNQYVFEKVMGPICQHRMLRGGL